MHFGCVELVEQHDSTCSSRRARHVVSCRGMTWRAKWNFGFTPGGPSARGSVLGIVCIRYVLNLSTRRVLVITSVELRVVTVICFANHGFVVYFACVGIMLYIQIKGLSDIRRTQTIASGGFRGRPSRLCFPPLGDELTPSLTVM